MPKAGPSFSAGEYVLVADRIALFYERFPHGRIITELVSRSEREVTFKALVYRSPEEREPAATGWASEREGDGDVNLVACLENTETSAIGRALANLGFTASRRRPSLEEMAKAERALQAHAGAITDVLTLLAAAWGEGGGTPKMAPQRGGAPPPRAGGSPGPAGGAPPGPFPPPC